MKRAFPHGASVLCVSLIVVVFLHLGANRCVASPPAEPGEETTETCELQIDGTLVEKIILVNRAGVPQEIVRPEQSVSLPPGEYRVQQVILEGNYNHYDYAGASEAWFSLTPGRPHQLTVGAPLEPKLEVTRTGRIVRLSHQLVDREGRDYQFRGLGGRLDPPQFTACRGERQIGSGTFEYG